MNSGSWWWTGRPGVLRFMGSQRVGYDWATDLNWTVFLHWLSLIDNLLVTIYNITTTKLTLMQSIELGSPFFFYEAGIDPIILLEEALLELYKDLFIMVLLFLLFVWTLYFPGLFTYPFWPQLQLTFFFFFKFYFIFKLYIIVYSWLLFVLECIISFLWPVLLQWLPCYHFICVCLWQPGGEKR